MPKLWRRHPLPDPIDSVPVLRLPAARSNHHPCAVEVQVHGGSHVNDSKKEKGDVAEVKYSMNNGS